MALQTDPNYSQISHLLSASEAGPRELFPSRTHFRKRGVFAIVFFALSGLLLFAGLKMRTVTQNVTVHHGHMSRLVERADTIWGFVDGGLGRACRDEDADAGSDGVTFDSHKNVVSVDECKALCLDAKVCKGIEYNSDLSRCEVWIQSIGGSAKSDGYACLTKGPAPTKAVAKKSDKSKTGDHIKDEDKPVDQIANKSISKEKKAKVSDKSTNDKSDDSDKHDKRKTDHVKKPACTKKFVPPPKPDTATQHNGVALNDVCLPGSGPHHVFLIGDWGGIPAAGGKISCAPHLNSRWNDSKPYAFIWPPDESAQFRVRDEMRKRAKSSKPEYVLNVGDNFYWAGVNDRCGAKDISALYSKGGNGVYKHLPVNQFKDEFEDVYTGEGLDGLTWLGVLGNHDYGGWLFNSAWDQIIGYTWSKAPESTGRWMTPAMYYSVTVKYSDFSVDYYFIDTNLFDALDPPNPSPHNICSQQHNEDGATCAPAGPSNIWDCQKWFRKLWTDQKIWLDKIVPHSKGHWRIMVTHFPPYWGSGEWLELTKKHHFDLIITGHRHLQNVHKKGDPPKMIWTNDPKKLMDDFLDPTAWIVTGGGGGVTSEHTPDAAGEDDQYGFMDMKLTKDEITVDAISHGGQIRRSMKIEPSFPHNPHYVKEKV